MSDADLLETYYRHLDALKVLASDPPDDFTGIRALAIREADRCHRAITIAVAARRGIAKLGRVTLFGRYDSNSYRAYDPHACDWVELPCARQPQLAHLYN